MRRGPLRRDQATHAQRVRVRAEPIRVRVVTHEPTLASTVRVRWVVPTAIARAVVQVTVVQVTVVQVTVARLRVVQVQVGQVQVVQVRVGQVPVGRRGSVRTVIVRVLQVVGAMIGARAVTIAGVRRARANVPVATRVSHHAA